MDEITQSLISVMKKELPRHPPTFDNLYEYFISRSRKNLHVVLCFSPVSFYCSYMYAGGITYLNVFRWFTFSDEMIYSETNTCYIEIKLILYYYQSPWTKISYQGVKYSSDLKLLHRPQLSLLNI